MCVKGNEIISDQHSRHSTISTLANTKLEMALHRQILTDTHRMETKGHHDPNMFPFNSNFIQKWQKEQTDVLKYSRINKDISTLLKSDVFSIAKKHEKICLCLAEPSPSAVKKIPTLNALYNLHNKHEVICFT